MLQTIRTPNPRGGYCNECSRRVGFPPSAPSRLWSDSFFLGLRGRADICSPCWDLLPLTPGIPSVSSHESHISQIIDVETVGLFIPRTQITAEGRISPEVPTGTTQIIHEG